MAKSPSIMSVATPTAREFIERQKKRLPGREFRMKDIGRRGWHVWRCEAVTLQEQSNYPQKVSIVMRLRLVRNEGQRFYAGGAEVGDIEYRFGYYTVARNAKWWWGQYALMLPIQDLVPLLKLAREEETLLEDFLIGR